VFRAVLISLIITAAVMLLIFAVLNLYPHPFLSEYEWTTADVSSAETGEKLTTVDLRIADDGVKKYVGLSQTESMPKNEGLLFTYDKPDEQSIVMRNMDFELDIIYVDEDGTITTIHENAHPSSSETYTGYGQYVIEVNGGFANTYDIEEGDTVNLSSLN